ncbi:hypothetical protein BCD67_10345 [Oscillatoriales cyanobacterium USR001]|nr:hypothetical protein BCD67_10345 [Oscillatoriales cyanobacterium USR001]
MTTNSTTDILNAILANASCQGILSQGDRAILKEAIVSSSFDEEAQQLVNRLLHAIRRGWVRYALEA